MNYEELKYFIDKKMRMSHIYQPIMLIALLQNKGECDESGIARAILDHDQSQIEYYQKITNNMVGRVLRNHKIVERVNGMYSLNDYSTLSESEISSLIELCRSKLDEYIEKRGKKIWEHRRNASGYISGTIKYEVLKNAKFHCELCGVPADEKALEVDHILPRNKGGSDDLINFQALCYSCNAMKRDRDDTDFHIIRESFKHRDNDCLFCNMDKKRILDENELAYAIYDGYPVTNLHTLIIPKRHVATYFDLGQAEINACHQLIHAYRAKIEEEDGYVNGFNIGMNNGETAGQTIFHCHIHLIPRRTGDIQNPRGGVRGVIPDKMNY